MGTGYLGCEWPHPDLYSHGYSHANIYSSAHAGPNRNAYAPANGHACTNLYFYSYIYTGGSNGRYCEHPIYTATATPAANDHPLGAFARVEQRVRVQRILDAGL